MVRCFIKKLFYEYRGSRAVISASLRYYQLMHTYLVPSKFHIRRAYFKENQRYPNIEFPETFTEKILWLKLYENSELHEICADKIRVRDHVARVLGDEVLIPCFATDDKITYELIRKIPDNTPVFFKTNHGSSGGVSFRNKTDINFDKLDAIMSHHLARNHYYHSREKQYRSIKPRVLVEKMLLENDRSPMDYKILCFNGVAKLVQVDVDRFSAHRQNYYDREWNRVPVKFNYDGGQDIVRPARLDDMFEMAEKLAKEFYFVRIDFYTLEDKIYFGEVTFHPESGYRVFTPRHFEVLFGSYIKLPVEHDSPSYIDTEGA